MTTTNNVIRNDGMRFYGAWDMTDAKIALPYDGVEQEVAVGGSYIFITHDYRVHTYRNDSDPVAPEVLRRKLATLGFEFREYFILGNAMKRSALKDRYDSFALFGVVGIGESKWVDGWIHVHRGEEDFVVSKYQGDSSEPYDLLLVSNVKKEVSRRVNEARRWINQTFAGFLRRVKLSDLEAVDFFERASHATIIRFNIGETTDGRWQGSSYFGSGGDHGSWRKWGAVSEVQETGSHDNGFFRSGSTQIRFDGPGALYTYAGDSINGGRTFWRELCIADGNVVNREPQAD